MKKILSLIMLATSIYGFSLNDIDVNNQTRTSINNPVGLRSVEGLEEQGYIIIRNFVDLARIGRTPDDRTWNLSNATTRPAVITPAGYNAGIRDRGVPDHLSTFETTPESRFILANDIELPFVGTLRIDIERAVEEETATEDENLKYDLNLLIPDYFRHGDGSPTATINNSRIRGWQPVAAHFEGIFDGNGFTISGLAGDRMLGAGIRNQDGDSHRMINGLFGVVEGGTIKNLTVEIGQDIELCNLPELSNATARNQLRESILSLTSHGFEPARGNALCISGTWIPGGSRTEGGVGGIVGVLINGYVHNSVTRSRSENSQLNIRFARVGGLVGFSVGGTITDSASYVIQSGRGINNTGPGTGNVGRYTGGLIGYSRLNSVITNSYAKGVIAQGGGSIGGLVGNTSGGLRIEDSFSGTQIIRADGLANQHGHPGGLVGRAAGTYPVIVNSFSFTRVDSSRVPLVDGIVGYLDGALATPDSHTNVFTTLPTARPGVTLLTREQMQNPLIVDNIMNQRYSFWHLDPLDESENVFPSHNPTPEIIQRVRVETPTTLIRYLDESIPVMASGYINLTVGVFTLTLERNGRREEIVLTISEDDLKSGNPIVIWSVIFHTPNNLFHAIAFFRERDIIEGIDPPEIGSVFTGWFDNRVGGDLITYMKDGHMSLWARFEDIIIFGNTNLGAEIILRSTYLVDPNHDDVRIELTALAGGTFMIPNIPAGQFILEIRLNGFIDELREIDTVGESTIDLGRIDLEALIVSGTAPSNSRIIITDANDNVIRTVNNTGYAGNFSFSQILDGEYFIIIEREGFVVRTEPFVVNRQHINLNDMFDEPGRLNLTAVSISGTALEGTVVSLYQGELYVTSVTVGIDGTFIFAADVNLSIHNTDYVVVARLERFNAQIREISIRGNNSYQFDFTQDEMLSIRGVTSQRTRISLISETGEIIKTTQSDAFGEFKFEGISNGIFTIRFERRNFEIVEYELHVNFTSIEFEDFRMTRIQNENSVIGVMVQGILVILAGIGVWSLLYKKKDTNIKK